jgi:hypothetical protein
MEKVSVQIDKYFADRISDLALKGAFGAGLVKCELDVIVRFILNNAMLSAGRKLAREDAAKEKVEQLQKVKQSIDILREMKN